eukprot:CAMPEP_0117453692 /NCGR_PEP_ID=MMETSP0759-20121206/10365_1 /TAXON_ID=63605 /ORGANISM="Percolomonas cosmopolitus, Strain WS" /LENGTH=742 /DNA_ID=CAMNT_0005246753 /DNA_START=46 /DNA_END=2274 /DNA_ORIENTATION=-
MRRKGMKRLDEGLRRIMGRLGDGILGLLRAESDEDGDDESDEDHEGTPSSSHEGNYVYRPTEAAPQSPLLRLPYHTHRITFSSASSTCRLLQETFQILSMHFHHHSRYRKIYREERKKCIHEWLLHAHLIYKNAIQSSKHYFEKNKLRDTIGELSKKERMNKFLALGRRTFDQLRERYKMGGNEFSETDSVFSNGGSGIGVGVTLPAAVDPPISPVPSGLTINTIPTTLLNMSTTPPSAKIPIPALRITTAESHNTTPLASPVHPFTLSTPTEVTIWDPEMSISLGKTPEPVSPASQWHNIQAVIEFINDLCDVMISEFALVQKLFMRRDRDRIMFKMMHEICIIMEFIVDTILHDSEETSLLDKLSLASVLNSKCENATLRQLFALCDTDLESLFHRCKVIVAHKLNNYQLLEDIFDDPISSKSQERERAKQSSGGAGGTGGGLSAAKQWMRRLREPHRKEDEETHYMHPACPYVETYFRVLNQFQHVVALILLETDQFGGGKHNYVHSEENDEQLLAKHKQLVIGSILHNCDVHTSKMRNPVSKWVFRLNTLSYLMNRVVPKEDDAEQKHYESILRQELKGFVEEVWGEFLQMIHVPSDGGRGSVSARTNLEKLPIDFGDDCTSQYSFSLSGSIHGSSTRQSIMSAAALHRLQKTLSPPSAKQIRRIHDKAIELYNAQRRVLVYDARLMWQIRRAVSEWVVDQFRRFYKMCEVEWNRDSRVRGLTPDTLELWVQNLFQVA